MKMSELSSIAFACTNGFAAVAGQSGAVLKVSGKASSGMCSNGTAEAKRALETDMKLSLSTSKLKVEVLQTDWSKKISVDVVRVTAGNNR